MRFCCSDFPMVFRRKFLKGSQLWCPWLINSWHIRVKELPRVVIYFCLPVSLHNVQPLTLLSTFLTTEWRAKIIFYDEESEGGTGKLSPHGEFFRLTLSSMGKGLLFFLFLVRLTKVRIKIFSQNQHDDVMIRDVNIEMKT